MKFYLTLQKNAYWPTETRILTEVGIPKTWTDWNNGPLHAVGGVEIKYVCPPLPTGLDVVLCPHKHGCGVLKGKNDPDCWGDPRISLKSKFLKN